MKKIQMMLVGLTLIALKAQAGELPPLDLKMEPPLCKAPPSKRPRLQAERSRESKDAIKVDWYWPLVFDFNGDGWCDFAWAIPYPMNSKMESFFLEDILVLGGAREWRSPFKGGRRPWVLRIDTETWPVYNVDLTEAIMIYPKSGGAPYILGIGPDGLEYVAPGCREYVSVHRWDNEVDAFKKVDDVTRDAVITFYYSTVGQRCDRSKK
ncbi:hypothetical protein JNX00_15475 [Hydrogenophaga sp. YM1]|uniref:hypothetical protein n=1 Tax=Hydrogenophaga sp. YM1 TaxID=2806262 RepID=UPI00195C7428|nr:hypothetical protein [Hydrogenophaga sp. YM1]QRR33051.1 hypothetical protein JNX00_15475 [Hydrogenophaga sp. YM1]